MTSIDNFVLSMKVILSSIFILLTSACLAQRSSNSNIADRMYFGGDVTLRVSGPGTIIGASPMLGYQITDEWSAGVGLSAYYFKYRDDFSSSFYGGNLFSRYLVFENVFVQSEYHIINTEVSHSTPSGIVRSRENIPIWYVGGGYRQPIGGRAFANITLLYDLIDDPRGPYPNPTIRAGFNFGF